MENVKLTKDADALICVLYKEYLKRVKDGKPKRFAMDFDNSTKIHDELMPKWLSEDVDDTCRELHRSGLLNCLFADAGVYYVSLSEDAVIYMENRFRDGISSLLEHLKELASVIPWEAVI